LFVLVETKTPVLADRIFVLMGQTMFPNSGSVARAGNLALLKN